MGARLDGLDALRGAAALVVCVGHAEMLPHLLSERSYYLSVDLFFMLSGYVMARTYERRLGDDLSPSDFLRLRLKRLWPTMAAGAIIGFFTGLISFSPGVSFGLTVLALLLVPIVGFYFAYPTNTPAWSIFFELFANVFHSFVPKLAVRWYLVFAGVSAALLLVFTPHDLNVGATWRSFLLGFPRVLLAYSIGIVLWRTLGDKPRFRVEWALAAFFAAMVTLSIAKPPFGDLLFVVALCPLLIIGGLGQGGVLARPFVHLGAVSFPLYATHFPVLKLAVDGGGLTPWLAVMLAVLVAYLVGWAIGLGSRRRKLVSARA